MPPLLIKHCILCEDVRLERRNLNSFMGVYGATPDVGIVAKDMSVEVGFVLVFMAPPVDGKFIITAQLHGASGPIQTRVQPPVAELNFRSDLGPIIFGFRFATVFPGSGTYSIVLFDSGREFFRDTFRIVQGDLPA